MESILFLKFPVLLSKFSLLQFSLGLWTTSEFPCPDTCPLSYTIDTNTRVMYLKHNLTISLANHKYPLGLSHLHCEPKLPPWHPGISQIPCFAPSLVPPIYNLHNTEPKIYGSSYKLCDFLPPCLAYIVLSAKSNLCAFFFTDNYLSLQIQLSGHYDTLLLCLS